MTKKALVSVVLASIAVLAACTEGPPPAALTSGGVPGASTGGADFGPRKFPERLCEPLPMQGEDVEEYAFVTNPAPATGGTIVPGTYVLRALETFEGASAAPPDGHDHAAPAKRTGRVGRVTLYVTGNTLRFNEARAEAAPLPETTTRGYTYRTAGRQIEVTMECPTPGPLTAVEYSASPNELVLYADANHREVYALASQ